ncbi:pentapeptide repeat-containing protein [Actinomadura madurae]|uniref:pentapeptide repeat-containing protein n=2 Tax=Actinomadura madurae TaxID=1993 RepID=UPI002026FACD|nr:pentapeptide repeat-containing protein [Actinomadura madurae]MCP9948714.1 pentapeptide repeat-containing protein [Actinomadura madurae]MCP9965487.1 pentapeptide repeat-containing protein [Actinomadura madurae]MCQ0010526.1 pentapeptide repeat-containing protein [Actinomadura madurae]MCQ0014163.1 pentapeptide repeat-containing protein [Actinomadura madurae]URM94337.1 pentapeptide repeat-containing protein [Actinomadura madurae]
MADVDEKRAGQADTTRENVSGAEPAGGWKAMLWIWPAIVITIIASAGGLFGAQAALLVGGEVVAIIVFVAAHQLFGARLWLATGLAIVIASFVALAGLQQVRPDGWLASATKATAGPPKSSPSPAVDLHGQTIRPDQVAALRFRATNLSGTRLNGLDLRGKDFDGASARGASFRGSRLEGASFRGADLREACLRGARLEGVDLSGADLAGANVEGATISTESRQTASQWPPPGPVSNNACR